LTAQDVIDESNQLTNLLDQIERLLQVVLHPTVEGVDISGSDFTTRYNDLKTSSDTAWADFKNARDSFTP
jgi:hypothetical protein